MKKRRQELKYTQRDHDVMCEAREDSVRVDAHFNGIMAGIFIGVFGTLMVLGLVGAMDSNQCYYYEYVFQDGVENVTCQLGDKFSCGYNLNDCDNNKDYECVINVEFKSGYRECSR